MAEATHYRIWMNRHIHYASGSSHPNRRRPFNTLDSYMFMYVSDQGKGRQNLC